MFTAAKQSFLSLVRGDGSRSLGKDAHGEGKAGLASRAHRSLGRTKSGNQAVVESPPDSLVADPPPRSAASRMAVPLSPATSKQSSAETMFPDLIVRKQRQQSGGTGSMTTAVASVRTDHGEAAEFHQSNVRPDSGSDDDQDIELVMRYRDTMARVRSRSGGAVAPNDSPARYPRPAPSRKTEPPAPAEDPNMERILLPTVTLYRPVRPADATGLDLHQVARQTQMLGKQPSHYKIEDIMQGSRLPVHFSLRTELLEFNPKAPPSPELFREMEKRDITRRFRELVGFKGTEGGLEDMSEWAIINSMKRSEKKRKRRQKAALVQDWFEYDEGKRMWLSGVGDLVTSVIYVQ
ncbi:hypothetical protein DFJ74DRAFT_669488 [Hyaloraphidium curvatum]|nr:hypothetical protein DFJ74DRAFT_669488 [Hyaloraphidium curvatum]